MAVSPAPATAQQLPPHSSSAQALASSAVLARLRLETRGEHDGIERLLDLMGQLSRADYCGRLTQFYGFYAPLEAALRVRCLHDDSPTGEPMQLVQLLPRLNKTKLLQQDLHCLGVATEGLPVCRALPPLQTAPEVLGCLYVLEGATLGGLLITRHIQATLGITPAAGGRFFEGYGGRTGQMWQAMRELLARCAVDPHRENAVVANALATFACLRRWCEPAVLPPQLSTRQPYRGAIRA